MSEGEFAVIKKAFAAWFKEEVSKSEHAMEQEWLHFLSILKVEIRYAPGTDLFQQRAPTKP
jgi:hypothetical protein